MVFNATFNNISVLSWRSVLLMEETGVLRENHTCRKSLTSHILLYRVHSTWVIFKLTTLVVISSNCICSCKSNHHTIMTQTAPRYMYGIVIILVYNFRIVTRGFYSEKDAAAAVKQTLIAVQVNITVDRFVYIYIYIFKMF